MRITPLRRAGDLSVDSARSSTACTDEGGTGQPDRPAAPAPDLPVTEAELGPEDQKIIALARSARARVGSAEGAAVRDETGRTYAAAAVALPSLRVSALALAVAMAVSSGAAALEAAALVSDGQGPSEDDLGVVRDIGSGALIIHAGADGAVRETFHLS